MARLTSPENLLRLSVQMQANAEGISIQEICEDYNVSRRTAERMRDAILRVFPQVEELVEGRQKRWRMPPQTTSKLNTPSLEELIALNRGAATAEAQGDLHTASSLLSLSEKLRANLGRKAQLKMEPDLEGLIEADYVAVRPGPREAIPDKTIQLLRTAILTQQKISAYYDIKCMGFIQKHHEARSRNVEVGPLGFIMGNGTLHLVAISKNEHQSIKRYEISKLRDLKLLEIPFERPENFDLEKFSSGAFEIFRSLLRPVEWRFTPAVADIAANYQFHKDQKMIRNEDGSLTVSFITSGVKEMAWHLFRWGDQVEIISSRQLKEEYKGQVKAIAEHLGLTMEKEN